MVLNGQDNVFRKLNTVKGETLGLVSITALLLSLHLYGLWGFQIFGHIDISLPLVTTILIAIVWFFYALTGRLRIKRSLYVGLFLASLFVIWVGFEAFRSPEPVRGLTMFLLSVRNILILWLVGSSVGLIKDINRLNKLVFFMGVGVAGLSVVFFLWKAYSYSAIIANPDLLNPPLIYEVGRKGVLRLKGFAGDPNFYSLWMVVSLLCGFTLSKSIRSFWRWFGILVIGVSLLLAMSRGFALAFVGAILFLGFIWIIKRYWKRGEVRQYVKPLVVGGVFLFVLAFIPLPFFDGSVGQMVLERFRLGAGNRWELWSTVLNEEGQNFLIGSGLRGVEAVLSGRYSHNSYLDLIVETGIIGLFLWGLFIVLVSLRAIRLMRIRAILPWIHSWFITLIFLVGFSLIYNPFLWLLGAVILGYVTSAGSGVKVGKQVNKTALQ